VIGAAILAAAAIASPCHDPALALRCPDLVMGRPVGLRADRSPSGRRVVLRMASRIVNVGAGPAQLYGRRTSPLEMSAVQVVTDATGRRRWVRTGAELYYTSVPTRGGSYWKFLDAARFELWALDAAGKRTALVRIGPKHSYCLRDLKRVRTGPAVRRRPFFGACNQRASTQAITLGTSVGWADIYPASYPRNWIDVTGLRGCFDVIERVDPDHRLLEANEANNASSRVVRLPYRPGPQRCPAATR
jgi:hypothetical protein